MPDLLLELFSEEIPARMQRRAAEDLKSLVTTALVERGLTYEGAKAFATPRRLALAVIGLPVKGRDVREEKKGPRVGAPDAAVQGFLKSAGLSDISQARIDTDPKKGEFYVAVVDKPGQATADALSEIVPAAIRSFPWPKSMRWGDASSPTGSPYSTTRARGAEALRWVRPLQSIVCMFGPETEEPEIISFDVDGIAAGDATRGHQFLSPGAFRVKRLDDYMTKLERAHVVLDADRRKDIILTDARNLAMAQNLELVEDEGLLEEAAGLVEWPVALMGSFDASFLDVPAEVIRATIRANQKCFVLRDPATGALANRFILVSNMVASDGGKTIVAGNGRVIRARLSDALYFWTTDQSPLPDYVNDDNRDKPLDQRLAKLKALDIVFHEKLGTQGQRVERIQALAKSIAEILAAQSFFTSGVANSDDLDMERMFYVERAGRAAELCKADLMTEVVGEFPETQGLMGRRYASLQGEHASVAAAIEEHYKPQGPGDRVPTDPVSVAVALADKLDTLVGFWAIDEKPTGSKDPYALRRAALGVIRLVVENGIRLPLDILLERLFERSLDVYRRAQDARRRAEEKADEIERKRGARVERIGLPAAATEEGDVQALRADLLAFFHDRLKVLLRDQGARHDLVDAVLGVEGGADDLLLIVRRVEALGAFLDTDDGKNLLAGYRRAANILRAEEKKGHAGEFDAAPDAALLVTAEDKGLSGMLDMILPRAEESVANEDYAGAMRALAPLRIAVDAFFDKATVNADDPELRANRLKLLNRFRAATRAVADFSKIAG